MIYFLLLFIAWNWGALTPLPPPPARPPLYMTWKSGVFTQLTDEYVFTKYLKTEGFKFSSDFPLCF